MKRIKLYPPTTFIYILIFGFSLSIIGCIPPSKNKHVDISIDLKNADIQNIFNLQSQRNSDSLYTYLKHKDPSIRYSAALAFASNQDPNAISALQPLLKDPAEPVSIAAAYAIGQIGGDNAENILLNGFNKTDTFFVNQAFNKAVLEAVGKCGSINSLKYIGITDYDGRDTLEAGQALALYRSALRNKTTKDGTSKMIEIAKDKRKPINTRVISANYLARAKDTVGINEALELIKIINDSTVDPNIRMPLVTAVSKTKFDLIKNKLLDIYKKERDYRVKCNLINGLKNFPYQEIQSIVFSALKENNLHVQHTASNFFINNGSQNDAAVYWRLSRDSMNWETKTNLLTAANKNAASWSENLVWSINNDLKKIWKDTTLNQNYRAAAIQGLGQFGWNYKYIIQETFNQNNPILKTAGMSALSTVANKKDFNSFFGLGRNTVRKNLSVAFSDALNTGDAALKAIAADVLSNKKLNFKDQFENSSFLYVALRSLRLPAEIETAYAIQKAIDLFDNKKTEVTPPKPNNTINWGLINSLDSIPTANITTNKGSIEIELFPTQSPEAVSNFINLSKKGFYNKKYIHRVVPNFVIQSGCPRGDGYGSLDYTIDSELGMQYYDGEGYLGMADAGIHTAGTQWFITHSPTPHLDGRYTIFGKVKNGMEVVHQLMKGDLVNEINIK